MKTSTTTFDKVQCSGVTVKGNGRKLLSLCDGTNSNERASFDADGTLWAPHGVYKTTNSGAAYSVTIPGYVPGRVYCIRLSAAITAVSTLSVNNGAACELDNVKGKAIKAASLNAVLPVYQPDAASNFLCPVEGGAYDIGDTITEYTNLSLTAAGAIPGGTVKSYGYRGPWEYLYGIAVSPSAIYLAGRNDLSGPYYGVMKLDKSGNQIWESLSPANGRDVALDSSENVYVAYSNGSGTTNVQKFDKNGNSLWALTDVGNAYGIAVDASGNVYVAYNNASGKTVRKLNSGGAEVWSLSDVANAADIAVDSGGNVYVAYNNASGTTNVRKLNSSGSQVWALTDVGNAYGIAVDASGNVYAAYSNSAGTTNVRKLDPSGTQVWADTTGGNARRVCVDAYGNVFASYENSGACIQRFNSSGVLIWTYYEATQGIPFGVAYGITLDGNGFVYVTSDTFQYVDHYMQLYAYNTYVITS